MDWGGKVTSLGTTTLKDRSVSFGIKDGDRTKHFCVLGREGSGRPELVTQLILQDIRRGLGTLILDGSGTVTPLVLERLQGGEAERLIFLDPSDAEYPYAWNPLDDVKRLPAKERHDALVSLIAAIYQVPPSPLVTMTAEALLAKSETTLISFFELVTTVEARKKFFTNGEAVLKSFDAALAAEAETVKAVSEQGRYSGRDTLIRNLLGQKESKFTMEALEKGQIVIVDFSKIRMFPTRMNPLVRVFVRAAWIAARAAPAPIPLYLYDCLRYLDDEGIDRAFGDTKLAITVADTIAQEADRERREKALARCGAVASFATHPSDRSLIERAFYPYADSDDLSSMGRGEMIVALTIDAVRTRAFFARMAPLGARANISSQDLILGARGKYALSRTEVDTSFSTGKKNDTDGKGPKDGSFSDAFRNIFAKRAGGVTPPDPSPEPEAKKPEPSGEAAPGQKAAKKPAGASAGKDGASASDPVEVPEEDLKAMLYVRPVSA